MRFLKTKIAVLSLGLMVSSGASADVVIDEIMYDLPGTDTGREWVEIQNTGADAAIIATTTWKFFESNTNHGLTLFQGNQTLPAGGFAIIADNPQKFLIDWPNFSGTIFDSVFSLGNVNETIALKSGTTTIADQVSYNSRMGANGDGNSLQKINGVWVAAAPTPGAQNQNPSGGGSGATTTPPQNQATTTPDAAGSDAASEPAAASDNRNTTNWPVAPQMMSRILGPSVAIAGADIIFKGEALGLDKKPLENPRYLWNFGDGATKEGESVLHTYNFPGDYVVILDASSGKFDAESRQKISVVPAELSIADVVAGIDGKIELTNGSSRELDLSWWRISSGGKFFTLPKNTKILAKAKLPLAAAVLGFPVDEDNLAVLYPNGVVAYKFENKTPTSPVGFAGQSAPVVATVVSPPAVSENQNVPPKPIAQKQSVSTVTSKIVLPVPASAQFASVANAFPNATGTVAKTSDNPKSSSFWWFYGAGGVIVLGLGFVLWPKPTTTVSAPVYKNEAGEYEIVEE